MLHSHTHIYIYIYIGQHTHTQQGHIRIGDSSTPPHTPADASLSSIRRGRPSSPCRRSTATASTRRATLRPRSRYPSLAGATTRAPPLQSHGALQLTYVLIDHLNYFTFCATYFAYLLPRDYLIFKGALQLLMNRYG